MKDVVWFDMEFVDRLLNTQYQEVLRLAGVGAGRHGN